MPPIEYDGLVEEIENERAYVKISQDGKEQFIMVCDSGLLEKYNANFVGAKIKYFPHMPEKIRLVSKNSFLSKFFNKK